LNAYVEGDHTDHNFAVIWYGTTSWEVFSFMKLS